MEHATLLPIAIKVDKAKLPAELLEELKPLKTRRPIRFFLEVVYCWAVVFGVISLAVYLDHWLATLVAIFIVATRQSILGLLIHEQTHCTSLKANPGDLVTNILAAYPLLILTVEGHSQVHLAHHSKYFSDNDPDHVRKAGEEWNYPMPPSRFIKILLRDILGLNIIKLIKSKKGDPADISTVRKNNIPGWARPMFFLICAVIFTATGTWDLFLIYWLLPLLTILQIIIRWGAVCEHQYNRLDESVQATTPLIILNWWEKFLLPNLNFTYHIYHHYFPSVSFSQLPKVHALFVRYGLVDDSAVFYGYWSYLKFVLSFGTVANKNQ